jgi:hypothetical protein
MGLLRRIFGVDPPELSMNTDEARALAHRLAKLEDEHHYLRMRFEKLRGIVTGGLSRSRLAAVEPDEDDDEDEEPEVDWFAVRRGGER